MNTKLDVVRDLVSQAMDIEEGIRILSTQSHTISLRSEIREPMVTSVMRDAIHEAANSYLPDTVAKARGMLERKLADVKKQLGTASATYVNQT